MLAWLYKDLKDIPLKVVQYYISFIFNSKEIKKRQINPQLQLIINGELINLLQIGFIKLIEIINWIFLKVLVKKKMAS